MATSASQLALKPPCVYKKQPLVLSIDDAMVLKSGCHFEDCAHLFDHARHNGPGYLDGRCFVYSLCLFGMKQDVNICLFPFEYRMWTKEKSKLEMAAELVQFSMSIIGSSHPVFLCCDSWYPKGQF